MIDSQQAFPPASNDDDVNLAELIGVLWARKWLIGGTTIIATTIALIIVLLLPNTYQSEALLAPNNQGGVSGFSSTSAQFGGLASLAGIDLGKDANDKTALGLEILKSRRFISEFIERHDILVPLMAAKGWNAKTGELVIDSDDYDVATNTWVRSVRPPRKTVPSMQEAYEEFAGILSVSQDGDTGFVTVRIEYYSPDAAKQWVDWLVNDLNASVVRKDVTEAEQAIDYLNSQIASTSLAELQKVFFGLIEEQTKTVMLANVSEEYLLKTIDPAIAPEEKSKPRRALIVLISFFLSAMSAVAGVIVFYRRL